MFRILFWAVPGTTSPASWNRKLLPAFLAFESGCTCVKQVTVEPQLPENYGMVHLGFALYHVLPQGSHKIKSYLASVLWGIAEKKKRGVWWWKRYNSHLSCHPSFIFLALAAVQLDVLGALWSLASRPLTCTESAHHVSLNRVLTFWRHWWIYPSSVS